MDIVLNDYSLNGQFQSTEEFALWIQREWVKMFDYLVEQKIALYKKSNFYSRYITNDKTLYDLLQISGDPIVSKIKSFIINSAFSPPFWDEEGIIKTDISNTYKCLFDEELPNCFSEAIERDKVILSIKNNEFSDESYPYSKNEEKGRLTNIIDYNSFLQCLLGTNIGDVRYIFENYRFQRKIRFVEIDGKCYAEEALLQNHLTTDDKRNILINISELIRGLNTGTKNRFWDSLSDGIFEYRISVSAGREFRLLFVQDKAINFLNGFIKKEQKTPKYELDKAKKIKREFFENRL